MRQRSASYIKKFDLLTEEVSEMRKLSKQQAQRVDRESKEELPNSLLSHLYSPIIKEQPHAYPEANIHSESPIKHLIDHCPQVKTVLDSMPAKILKPKSSKKSIKRSNSVDRSKVLKSSRSVKSRRSSVSASQSKKKYARPASELSRIKDQNRSQGHQTTRRLIQILKSPPVLSK